MALTLAFDCSAAHCAAALRLDGADLAHRAEVMNRGQAERLMPLLEEVLAEAGLGWRDVTRLGVGTGPGNFTGIRIAVAAARGLSLGLGVPAIGVTGFAVIHAVQPARLAAIPGPLGRWHVMPPGGPAGMADDAPDAALPPEPAQAASLIAQLAETATPGTRPAPFYNRAADAAPASDAPPVILDA